MSAITTRVYLHSVEEFARYFKTPPDSLGLEQIRQYQAHLSTDRKLEVVSIAQHHRPRMGALHDFEIVPKTGPFKSGVPAAGPEVENMFMASFNATVDTSIGSAARNADTVSLRLVTHSSFDGITSLDLKWSPHSLHHPPTYIQSYCSSEWTQQKTPLAQFVH